MPPESEFSRNAEVISAPRIAAAIDVCTDYGIDTVTMKVLSGDNVLASAGYTCSLHAGKLTNVPAGNNLVLRLEANVPGAGIVWTGDVGFNLGVGEEKNLGEISMSYTGSDTTPPTILSVSPVNDAFDVTSNSTIRIQFSERMAINTVQDAGAIEVADNVTGSLTGSILYNATDKVATFTPDSPFAVGSRVTVSVTPNPTDMAGNRMSASYPFGFSVRYPGQWGTPFLIETNQFTTGNGSGPYSDVALSDKGDAFAVWQETIGNSIYVYGSRYDASRNRWETPVNISPTTTNYCWGARVAADNVGNAIAVWIQEYGYVVAKRYSGGAWTGQVTFNDLAIQGYASGHGVAMDRTGNALISYIAILNGTGKIYVSSYSPTTGQWNLNDYSAGANCQGSIQGQKIAMKQGAKNHMLLYSCDDGIYQDDSPPKKIGIGGNFDVSIRGFKAVAVWDNTDGIWASFNNQQVYPYGWTVPVQIGSGGSSPSVMMNDAGQIVAVWGGGVENVFASSATFAGQAWGSPVNLSGQPPGDTGNYTRVGLDRDGNAIVAWLQQVDGDEIYVSRRYDSGMETWVAATENISKNNLDQDPSPFPSRAAYPGFSMNDSGDAVAVWLRFEDESNYPSVYSSFRYK